MARPLPESDHLGLLASISDSAQRIESVSDRINETKLSAIRANCWQRRTRFWAARQTHVIDPQPQLRLFSQPMATIADLEQLIADVETTLTVAEVERDETWVAALRARLPLLWLQRVRSLRSYEPVVRDPAYPAGPP
jgi:hypothetical protein